MKRTLAATLCVIVAGGSLALLAQSSGQKSLSSTLSIYAFPQAGQKPEQQSQDEAACYSWAVQNTGVDPFELQKKAAQQQQQTAQAAGQTQAAGGGRGRQGRREGRGWRSPHRRCRRRRRYRGCRRSRRGSGRGPEEEETGRGASAAGAGAGPAGPAGHGRADGQLQEGLLRLHGREKVHRQVLSCQAHYFKVLKGQGPAALLRKMDFVLKPERGNDRRLRARAE
jgi:hypothetical protein